MTGGRLSLSLCLTLQVENKIEDCRYLENFLYGTVMVWQILTLAVAERLMLTQRKVGGFGHSKTYIWNLFEY